MKSRKVEKKQGHCIPYGKKNIRLTVSIGLTELNTRTDSLEAMIKRADSALYKAKQQGRNRVVSRV